jgi:tetratricopeptide (TPR) repeat protein
MPEIMNLIADARRAVMDHRFDDAAAQASDVLKYLPSCLAALRILAWAQLELGDDAALDAFERCAAYDPEDALAYVGQAIWYQQRRQNEAARRSWVCAWERNPDNQMIRRALVKLTGELPESLLADAIGLLQAGRPEDAADILNRLHAHGSDPTIALALLSALWASGAQHEAFEMAASAHANWGVSVKAALYIAAVEDRAGRTLRAREALARAEQVDPGLTLFADVVRQVGLQPAVDLHRAHRAPLAAAR